MKYEIGQKFGFLTIEGFKKRGGYNLIICKCECGNTSVRRKIDKTRKLWSCGCQTHTAINMGNNSSIWKGYGEIAASYFAAIRCSAKNRNIDFNLTMEYCWELFLKQNRKCIYTNIELKFSTQKRIAKGFEQTASLDRIDPNLGYIKDNVQWIHKKINRIKHIHNHQDFLNICNKISNNTIINNKVRPKKHSNPKWKGCGDISAVYFWDVQNKARQRELEFKITIKEAWDKFLQQQGNCQFIKEKLTFATSSEKKHGKEQTASLDRIDSSKGYTIDNIQWVHKDINKMKSNMSNDEFLYWIGLVIKTHGTSTSKIPATTP